MQHQSVSYIIGIANMSLDYRNCLVGKGFTVKISDVAVYRSMFARDYYYIDGRGLLPVRWMAPETLLWVSVSLNT